MNDVVKARPLEWMRAVRDVRPKRPSGQFSALVAVALRMDSRGAGFISTAQIVDDSGMSHATAKRATDWGRRARYLLRTRRGHRLGDGRTVASEWQLTLPVDNSAQQLTSDPLSGSSTAQTSNLNSSNEQSQQLTRDYPRGPLQEVLLKSSCATEDEAKRVLDTINAENPRIRNLSAYVAKLAATGDLRARIDRMRADRDRGDVRAVLDELRRKPPCIHGEAGGDQPHPTSGQPLCALCRTERR